ncbi:MAG: type II secretion system protein [Aquificae bacterium]|nr:type II secretion system protein [Aquificota bacterium]
MNSKESKRGFSLLELIVVITLLSIVFGIIGTVFINSSKGITQVQINIQKEIKNLSFLNQLSKQLFAKYEKKPQNIVIQRDRISFYTYYSLFFEGAVRAEYIFEETENDLIKVTYEEAPYVDGKLGIQGLKRQYIGLYKKVTVDVLQGDSWFENYRGKLFPRIIKLTLDGEQFYITIRRQ